VTQVEVLAWVKFEQPRSLQKQFVNGSSMRQQHVQLCATQVYCRG
jgi:hypothetical protein